MTDNNKLLGLLPITSDFLVEFTPDEYNEIDEELRPIFILSPWNSSQIKQLAKMGSDDNMALNCIATQIKGWKNLKRLNANGELTDIDYEQDDASKGVKRSLLNEIPTKITLSLMKRLTQISGC